MKKPALPPYRGASTNASFFATGLPFAPAGSLENVIPFDSTKDRPRMGTRPGTREYFSGTWGNGSRVQGCGVVSRGKTATGLELGTGTDLPNDNGSGHTQPAIAGNLWRFDNAWGLTAYDYEDVTSGGPYSDTGAAGAANKIVSVCCLSPDKTKVIIGETYSDGSGNTVARVTCRNATTLAVVWSKKLSDSGIDRFISAVTCSADWVFVCTNHFLRVYKIADGANPGVGSNVYGMNGWSSVAVDAKVDAAGTSLYCLFRGSTLAPAITGMPAGELESGCKVTAGVYAEHFRAGCMKFTIATQAQITAGTATTVLTQVVWTTQLGHSDRYYEGLPSPNISRHGYLRFSEKMPWAPRGMRPTALALTSDGGIAVTHCNAAWGPDGDPTHTVAGGYGHDDYLPPDGSVGYVNVSVFGPSGAYLFSRDGDSIKNEDGGGGNFNDLLNPTALAIAIGSNGDIFTAGRRTKTVGTADGYTNWAWDTNGDFLWASDLGGTMRAIAIPTTSGLPTVAGDRNSDFTGAGADYAHLFELRQDSGAILRKIDLGAVDAKCVVAGTDDAITMGTGKI